MGHAIPPQSNDARSYGVATQTRGSCGCSAGGWRRVSWGMAGSQPLSLLWSACQEPECCHLNCLPMSPLSRWGLPTLDRPRPLTEAHGHGSAKPRSPPGAFTSTCAARHTPSPGFWHHFRFPGFGDLLHKCVFWLSLCTCHQARFTMDDWCPLPSKIPRKCSAHQPAR